MPIKKWCIQYLLAWPVVFFLLGGVQYLKDRGLDYAVEFGLLWSLLTLALFAAVRVYYFRKGLYCKFFDDLPQDSPSDKLE